MNGYLMIFVVLGLKLSYHSEAVVSHDDHLNCNALLHDGSKLHHLHLERAVAADNHNLTIGSCHFCAHSAGN